jgi:hypothetical protein
MTQDKKARKICCRLCRAGVGERCLDQRPGFKGLRIITVHPVRIADAKAKGI